MTDQSLLKKIAHARTVKMSQADRERQRLSFAFGSAHLENKDVTRDVVRMASESLRANARRMR